MTIVKRGALPWYRAWMIRIAAILIALILCGLISYFLIGENPVSIYKTIIDGSFRSGRQLWKMLQELAILLCVSIAVTPAFKMRFWNIGAEGQVLMGGLATAICMLFLGNSLPTPVLFIVMIVTSILAGIIWAVIPAVFKAIWNTNETLFTLMMNYIAIQLVGYFIMKIATNGSGIIGVINQDTNAGWLPAIGMGRVSDTHIINIAVVLVLTAAEFIYLKYSKHGYEISVVGESENTARYIGINVKKVIMRTMALSGAICGIAGFLLVSGTDHTITKDTAGGRGFTAIMVSWLAKFNPLIMIITSFLIVFMQRGAEELHSVYKSIDSSYADILTGIIIFFIIGCEFFINYKFMFYRKAAVTKEKTPETAGSEEEDR